MIDAGSPAPDFNLPDPDGNRVEHSGQTSALLGTDTATDGFCPGLERA